MAQNVFWDLSDHFLRDRGPVSDMSRQVLSFAVLHLNYSLRLNEHFYWHPTSVRIEAIWLMPVQWRSRNWGCRSWSWNFIESIQFFGKPSTAVDYIDMVGTPIGTQKFLRLSINQHPKTLARFWVTHLLRLWLRPRQVRDLSNNHQ